MAESRAPGPTNEQAAMAMGHSVQAWRNSYDKNFIQRSCQAGVNAMGPWKQHMLHNAPGAQDTENNDVQQAEDADGNHGNESNIVLGLY